MITNFKTEPCTQDAQGNHDRRSCAFFHCARDRRRPLKTQGPHKYSAEPCPDEFDDERICPLGDNCPKAHSTAELLYHPELFRKRLCHLAKRCPRAQYCAFAHSRGELLVPHFGEGLEAQPPEQFILYEFKTQWCPLGGFHDWENCVYAHTFRDWRRTPRIGYCSRPCPHWTRSVSGGAPRVSYLERCPHGFNCPMAHGAKEQLYHPHFYKTSPCSDAGCHRGTLCAFTHEDRDVRCVECDNGFRPGKDPLEGAERILRLYQPNYATPPKYHALEEGIPKGQGKQRKRAAKAAEPQRVELVEPPMNTWQNGWEQWPNYSWMAQGQDYASWTGDIDSEWRALSTLPCQVSVPSSPARTGHEVVEAPSPQAAWSWNMNCMPPVPTMVDPAFFMMPDLVNKEPVKERKKSVKSLEDILWRRSLAHGMRTPSSFGSPPLSGTATEVPTPRPDYEVAGSSQDAASTDIGDGEISYMGMEP